jgi:predicted HTH transcriptional regulator
MVYAAPSSGRSPFIFALFLLTHLLTAFGTALPYVMAYGKNTRKQAAELCKIYSTQARNLLSWLVKKGVLEMHGSKKGAYYVDASRNMDEST